MPIEIRKHEHKYKLQTKHIPLHRYVKEDGKTIKDLITGKDVIQVLECSCGDFSVQSFERTYT